MLKNYFKITLRHLWRNRLFVMLNIAGLAIGISACWVIYRIVSYEFSFDTWQPNREHIYRVVSRFNFAGDESGNGGAPLPMADAIREQVDGLELIVPLHLLNISTAAIPQVNDKPLAVEDIKDAVAVDSRYFELMQYEWLAGNTNKALNEPNQLVLTQSRALKYFPESSLEQLIGKTILYNDSVTVQVAGVVADPDYPTVFSGKEFISRTTFPEYRTTSSENWGGVNSSDQLYVLLSPFMDKKRVEAQINRLSQKNMPEDAKGYKRWHLLQPLRDIHFNSDYPSGGRIAHKPTLYGLIAIAVFLLLLACINYTNLSIAQLPQRAREIGILKSLGSSSIRLIFRFLGETLLILVLALGLSGLLTQLFFSSYQDLVPEGIERYVNNWKIILFLVGLILVVGIVSGLYPGWMLARFQPVSILRGQQSLSSPGKHSRFTLSKSLIVFQFVIAQAFIVGALIAAQQLKYALEKDMGFDEGAVLLMEVPFKLRHEEENTGRRFALKQELEKLPGIDRVSLGNPPASSSWFNDLVTYKSEKGEIERPVYQKYVDTGMLSLYGMRLLAGRNLRESDTVAECVINETYVKQFGFTSPEEAIGKYLASSDENKPPIPIVGVVADFHQLSFHHKIEPVALMTSRESLYTFNIKTFNIKLASKRSADWEQAIKAIKNTWGRFYPGQAFEYKFYDEVIASFYKTEQRMARVINLSTGIAIIISCFGLFGLTTLTTVQRTKEIGIRKVLGASVASVLALLSKDFIKLVLIAIAIASPIAWYVMSRWLQDFAYRIEIEWWMFVLAGLLAIVIALLTVSFQSVKAALMNPVRSLRSE